MYMYMYNYNMYNYSIYVLQPLTHIIPNVCSQVLLVPVRLWQWEAATGMCVAGGKLPASNGCIGSAADFFSEEWIQENDQLQVTVVLL